MAVHQISSMAQSPSEFFERAFASNIGLLSPDEQAKLRQATVAIPGMGGVGGAHLLTLARLGVGRFKIADRDVFELPNINRQVGATSQTMGRLKTDVMAAMAKDINPHATVDTLQDEITSANIDRFLEGADVVIDGLDFFRIDARRLLFARARAKRLPVVTCGPLGFSVALLTFLPDGPSFDEFMAIDDRMTEQEQLIRFAVGLAPAGLHIPYLDLGRINLAERRGPSSVVAINLCAAVAATETLNLILQRRPPLAVPRYAQFDPYRLHYRRGTLWLGNRHPWQQMKLWYLRRRLKDVLAAQS